MALYERALSTPSPGGADTRVDSLRRTLQVSHMVTNKDVCRHRYDSTCVKLVNQLKLVNPVIVVILALNDVRSFYGGKQNDKQIVKELHNVALMLE